MDRAEEVLRIVREQRRKLEALPFAELATFPELETVAKLASGVQITVARKSNPDGSLTILVEGWHPSCFGMVTQRTGDGFKMTPSGQRTELEESDHW